jgi:hypothetical protein
MGIAAEFDTRTCPHHHIALWPFAHRVHTHFYLQQWLLCRGGKFEIRWYGMFMYKKI